MKFRGKVIEVGVDTVVLPNGERAELEIVRHPGGAAVVAVDEAGRVCLTRQYRHAAGGWVWELPAGRIDPGEQPIETARRELEEEAGAAASEWVSLGTLLTSPGIFTEIIHLFGATGLTETSQSLERHEVLEAHWIPFAEALERARRGDIVDAKTVVGLFRAAESVRESTI